MNVATRLAFALCLVAPFAAPLACHDGRDANDPMLMNHDVQIVNEPTEGCKKVGTVHGIGRDSNDDLSKQQASDAAIDQAKRMYGDEIVFTDEKGEQVAGSGGMVTQTTKTGDVYQCPKTEAPKTEDSASEGSSAPPAEGGDVKE